MTHLVVFLFSPAAMSLAQVTARAPGLSVLCWTLRRVLCAYALQNPSIGLSTLYHNRNNAVWLVYFMGGKVHKF